MTFSASLDGLQATGTAERVGDETAARISDVHAFVAGEMREVETLVARHVERGVAPATDAARHLAEAGGKRVRPMALLLAAGCFSAAVPPRARTLAAAAELVHMATLLHDDVIDDADQRRGRPTSRRVWGNAVSVLGGDLLLVEALRLAGEAAPETLGELVTTLGRLVDGEVIQLRGRAVLSLEEDTYFEVVRGKTASLFEWALRAGAREGGAGPGAIDALGRFGAHLGLAFQLVDDILDYEGDPAAMGKNLFGDLAEGKVTLPLIRAAHSLPEVATLAARVRGGDEAVVPVLAAKVRGSGACEAVRRLAIETTAAALAELEHVPAGPRRDLLAEVAKTLSARVT